MVEMMREVLPRQNIENMLDTLIAYTMRTPANADHVQGQKDDVLYAYDNALRYIRDLEAALREKSEIVKGTPIVLACRVGHRGETENP